MNTKTYIVVLKDKTYREAFEIKAKSLGIKILKKWKYLPRLVALDATLDQYSAIKTNQMIEHIDTDREASITTTQNISGAPAYEDNWGLDRIDQRSPKLDSSYTYQRSAPDVDAYVIDTGIKFDHEDFGGRAQFLFDAFQEDGLPDGQDGNGHGTHVSGILGGGRFGVAKQVKLFAVKVLASSGRGTTVAVLDGINAVIQHHTDKNDPTFTRPSVANMSLSFGTPVVSVDTAVESMVDAGITVCVAAGNNADDAKNYSPARVEVALTTGAIRNISGNDSIAGFSNTAVGIVGDPDEPESQATNTGSVVDVFAPGLEITSAWPLRVISSELRFNTAEGFLGVLGKNQRVFFVSITVATNKVPFIQIGTREDTNLVIDAGPVGSGKPFILKEGRTHNFAIDVTLVDGGDLFVFMVDNNGSTAGSVSVNAKITSTNSTRRLSGTSMASPLTAGVVALRLQEESSGPIDASEVEIIHDFIIDVSTKNTIDDVPDGTPNRVLYMPYVLANTVIWQTPSGRIAAVEEDTFVNTTVNAVFINELGNEVAITDYTSSDLPTWLGLNNSTGNLTGTATLVSTDTIFEFTITATNGTNSLDRTFSIGVKDVPNQPPKWITPIGSLGTVIEDDSVTNLPIQLQAQDFEGDAFSFTVLNPNTQPLPPGLSLSLSGEITGTPGVLLVDQTFTFTVRLTDGVRVNDRTFSITEDAINFGPTWVPSIVSEPIILNSIDEQEIFSYDFSDTGLTDHAIDPDGDNITFSFDLQGGDEIPPNLTLTSGGILSGTVTEPGTFVFTVSVTDTVLSATRQFFLEVIALPINLPPEWVTPEGLLGSIAEEQASTFVVVATDPESAVLTYSLDLEAGDIFPPGLVLNSNGTITGNAGLILVDTTFYFRLRVEDPEGNFALRRFAIDIIDVVENLPPVWVTPEGFLGELNEHTRSILQLEATDPEEGILIFTVVSGNLPLGLTLNQVTGNIEGFAAEVNTDTTFTFTVNVSDNGGLSPDDRTFSITILNVNPDITIRVKVPVFDGDHQALREFSEAIIGEDISKLFRITDPNFGIPERYEMYMVDGLNLVPPAQTGAEFDDIFIQTLDTYHFKTKVLFGDLRRAIVLDINTNETVYEVIYVEINDLKKDAHSVLDGPLDYPQKDSPEQTQGLTVLTPNSLINMRDQLITTYGFSDDIELFEPWMSSLQDEDDPESALGWTPGIVLAYVNPGTALRLIQDVAEEEKSKIRNKPLIIDRYRITTTKTSDLTFFDFTLDENSTLFDTEIFVLFNKYIKFPQVEIQVSTQDTGDLLGVRPAS